MENPTQEFAASEGAQENEFPRPEEVTTSGTEANENAAAALYLREVRKRIETRKDYPPLARMSRAEGRTTLRFEIAEDGGMGRLYLKQSSGHRALDREALRTAEAASPFPPPPVGAFRLPVIVEVTVVFELK